MMMMMMMMMIRQYETVQFSTKYYSDCMSRYSVIRGTSTKTPCIDFSVFYFLEF